jgi:hypothetical protein
VADVTGACIIALGNPIPEDRQTLHHLLGILNAVIMELLVNTLSGSALPSFQS